MLAVPQVHVAAHCMRALCVDGPATNLLPPVPSSSLPFTNPCDHSTHFNPNKRKETADTLELLPLLPWDGLDAPPASMRPWVFTVLSTKPGLKPVAVGVEGGSLVEAPGAHALSARTNRQPPACGGARAAVCCCLQTLRHSALTKSMSASQDAL